MARHSTRAACTRARRLCLAARHRRPHRRIVGAGTLAVSLVAAAALWALATVRRVEVEGASMAPTLAAGDRLLVRRVRRGRGVRPGVVVVVRLPGRGEAVKRVAGVGGGLADLPDGPRRLGAGEVAVSGDSAADSTDSRHLGALPAGAVTGVAVARYHPPERAGGRESLATPSAPERGLRRPPRG